MPLGNPYKEATEDLTAHEAAVLDYLGDVGGPVPFRDVAGATVIHGWPQAAEKAVISLRKKGLVTANYESGMVAMRRSDAQ